MTYYETLEISQNASEEVVKMAYKALAKKYHPDVFLGDAQEADEKMKQINLAYSILSDSDKRAEYDAFLQNGKTHFVDSQETPKQKSGCRSKKGVFFSVAVLVVACITLCFTVFGSSKNIEEIKDSVVMVTVYDQERDVVATGSGFCAYKDNWIVTNFHVIEGAYTISVTTDDRKEISVTDVLFFNKEDDLAVLQIQDKLEPLTLGNGNNIKTKDKVTTVGSPKGELNTVSEGIISNVDTKHEIRISAPISHGSSGGVLLNRKNQVIGITSAGYDDAQNLNFAINVSVLKKLYADYKNDDCVLIGEDNISRYVGSLSNFENYMSSDATCYSVSSLNQFFKLTNDEARFEQLLKNNDYSWYSIYNSMSSSDQKLVLNTFLDLTEQQFNDNNVSSDIDDWNVTDFFISLNVLNKYQYAIACVDVGNYSDKNLMFDNVEDNYSLEAAEKSLILHLIGGYRWNEIHTDNKRDIFEYFDAKYGTEDLGAILETLGYEVVYENDGTLTGYW